jgi:hypothetical protein
MSADQRIYKIIYIGLRQSLRMARIRLILLVGAGRFERPTPCAQGRCATRLRYAPTGLHDNYSLARRPCAIVCPRAEPRTSMYY